MTIEEAIEHAKNKKGMKQSFGGLCNRSASILEWVSKKVPKGDGPDMASGYAFTLRELTKHFYMAREAFMEGDLETVAEFFGLYV